MSDYLRSEIAKASLAHREGELLEQAFTFVQLVPDEAGTSWISCREEGIAVSIDCAAAFATGGAPPHFPRDGYLRVFTEPLLQAPGPLPAGCAVDFQYAAEVSPPGAQHYRCERRESIAFLYFDEEEDDARLLDLMAQLVSAPEHQIGGVPFSIGEDVGEQARAHGLRDPMLLLQIDSEPERGCALGANGMLYVYIERSRFAQRLFGDALLLLQD